MKLRFSPERAKYDLRVKSYRSDKKQLDTELQKAIGRLKADADRDELMNMDEGLGLDQVYVSLMTFMTFFNFSKTN